jgi:hypothetical protein
VFVIASEAWQSGNRILSVAILKRKEDKIRPDCRVANALRNDME